MSIKPGVCVKIPDKRIGRVRNKIANNMWRVRVKRTTSNSHQFLFFNSKQLKVVPCPYGWMSVDGYKQYLKKTLKKMRQRSKT